MLRRESLAKWFVSRTGRSENNYLMTRKELYIRTLNNVYVIFGYDIPCCSRVVIFDYIVVLVSRFYWGFSICLIDM